MDQVLQDHDVDVLENKTKVEAMWREKSSKRERKTVACREAPGFSFFGDNIGISQLIKNMANQMISMSPSPMVWLLSLFY